MFQHSGPTPNQERNKALGSPHSPVVVFFFEIPRWFRPLPSPLQQAIGLKGKPVPLNHVSSTQGASLSLTE